MKGAAGVVAAAVLALWAGPARGEESKAARPAPEYDRVFAADRILDVHLTVSKEDWARLPKRPFEYVKAAFEADGAALEAVGLRVKGNSSSGVPSVRKSMKVDFDRFDSKGRFRGLSKLNFHNGFKDPTMMREVLAYRLFREAGVPASRTGYARIFITIPGECARKYLGLYVAVEQVDGSFLKDRFEEPSGNLFKGEAGSEFAFLGEDPEGWGGYELKRNEDRGDYARLIAFVKGLAEVPDAALPAFLETNLDVERFLAYAAANTLLANLDSPAGTGHNYYLYHEPGRDRFTLLPWDLNEAFGNFRQGPGADVERMSVDEPYSGDKILFRRVLSVARFRARYREILADLCRGPFSQASMDREIDRLHRLIRKAVQEDPLMSFSNEEFERALEEDLPGRGPMGRGREVLGLKSFVKNRLASVAAQLKGRDRGVKPAGREFRGPPPGASAFRGASTAAGGFLYLLGGDGTLRRLDVTTLEAAATGRMPGGAPEADERERPRAPRSSGPREAALFAGETVLAVVGPNTLYAFDRETLRPLGHNRFGPPTGTQFERRGRGAGEGGPPGFTGEGDEIWLLTDEEVLRLDLKTLTVEARAALPGSGAGPDPAAWLRAADLNGDGVIDRDEWRQLRAPPEQFQFADRNQDGVVDRKEAETLPAAPSTGAEKARRLHLAGETLVVILGDTLRVLDRKKLKPRN